MAGLGHDDSNADRKGAIVDLLLGCASATHASMRTKTELSGKQAQAIGYRGQAKSASHLDSGPVNQLLRYSTYIYRAADSEAKLARLRTFTTFASSLAVAERLISESVDGIRRSDLSPPEATELLQRVRTIAGLLHSADRQLGPTPQHEPPLKEKEEGSSCLSDTS